MRLGLECNVEVVVETDEPCVVDKGAVYPRCVDRVGSRTQVLIEQAVDLLDCLTRFVRYIDGCPERLMSTVFAPRLCDRLDFGVGRVAPHSGEVTSHRLHLDQVQAKSTAVGDGLEFIVRRINDCQDIGRRRDRLILDETSSK